MITFEVTISANRETEDHNTFSVKIIFRWRTEGTLVPHPIENSRIVLGYLWPNPYYQVPESNHAPSRVSLATGVVTASRESTLVDPESPPESLHEVTGLPPILLELLELPGITNYNQRVEALQLRIKEHNRHLRELPLIKE